VTYRLAAVYAHPDDDTFGVGGTLAKHAADVDYTLIVATSGEAGEISDPALADQENLAAVREVEEREALRELGVPNASIHFLRHPDGGLKDVPREGIVRRVAELLEEARPQVVVTFGPEGITRHDDHIAIGRIATEAFHDARNRAGEGAFSRLFYNAVPQSELDAFWEAARAEGIDMGDPDGPFMPRGVPDHTVTARFDGRDVWDKKLRALMAHRTQVSELTSIPLGMQKEFLASESFVQAWPPVSDPRGPVLASLFEGLGALPG
jgi:LmbE family N-acetylglucosaminyl deacetylase